VSYLSLPSSSSEVSSVLLSLFLLIDDGGGEGGYDADVAEVVPLRLLSSVLGGVAFGGRLLLVFVVELPEDDVLLAAAA